VRAGVVVQVAFQTPALALPASTIPARDADRLS
jgi:hypothetical protein